MLRGGEDIAAYVEKKLGIRTGESTSDGKFYLKREEECLAACVGAPMMMVDHVYHENLTPARVDRGNHRRVPVSVDFRPARSSGRRAADDSVANRRSR